MDRDTPPGFPIHVLWVAFLRPTAIMGAERQLRVQAGQSGPRGPPRARAPGAKTAYLVHFLSCLCGNTPPPPDPAEGFWLRGSAGRGVPVRVPARSEFWNLPMAQTTVCHSWAGSGPPTWLPLPVPYCTIPGRHPHIGSTHQGPACRQPAGKHHSQAAPGTSRRKEPPSRRHAEVGPRQPAPSVPKAGLSAAMSR